MSPAEKNLAAHADVVWVDLDGTLAQYAGWQGIYKIGPPFENARKFMEILTALGKKMGFRVGVFTVRTTAAYPGREQVLDNHPEVGTEPELVAKLVAIVEQWLLVNMIPYATVYAGQGKPVGKAYIDDRGVWCDPKNWSGGWTAYQIALDAVKVMAKK